MAQNPQDQPDAAAQAEAAEKQRAKDARAAQRQVEDEEQFPTERLIDESFAWFGVDSAALAGGLSLTNTTKKNLTLSEAQAAVDAFMAHTPENQEV